MSLFPSEQDDLRKDNWRIWRGFELLDEPETEALIRRRVIDILDPFDVSPEFIAKIVESAQSAVLHGSLYGSEVEKTAIVRIWFYLAAGVENQDGDWGFFRTARIDDDLETVDHRYLVIEYFLYQEF